MTNLIEQVIADTWNRFARRTSCTGSEDGLDLGGMVVDGELSRRHARITDTKRPEHIAILGKTGTGKSSLLRHMSGQDIRRDVGFVYFDLHGDTIPYLLKLIAGEEQRRSEDLSGRVIVVEPADTEYSVGINILEHGENPHHAFVQISEFSQILKQRWRLDSLGPRTEELLRNALYALAVNGMTLLEMGRLLTDSTFRSSCLRNVGNDEIKAYFTTRYDQASEAMQSLFRDAILNKISAFTADPHFRHIVGQSRSTFQVANALDGGCWVLINLDKGRLGEQAATLGSLFLARLKNALFSRQQRTLRVFYCDEVQNLVTFDAGLDTLLSEARKFGISVVTANQFLDQYPAQMRSAILAVGTHIFFQLSSPDADRIAAALDGGRSLSETLKNLPQRHMIVKSGHHRWVRAVTPSLVRPDVDASDLYERCRKRWARRRSEIDAEIEARQARVTTSSNKVLDDWE